MVVVGYRPVDFEDKQTGRQISGYTFYSIENDGSCTGRIAFKDFVPGSLPDVVSALVDAYNTTEEISVLRNRNGKITKVL